MTRIAFVSTMDGAPWGGSEELWSRTALRLLESEVAVAASVKEWTEPVRRITELERAGCHVYRRPTASLVQRLLHKVNSERHFRWLDEFKPDLVVMSQGYQFGDLKSMQVYARRKIPYAIVVQGAGEPYWPDDDALYSTKSGFEKAKATFFVSQGNLDLVRRQLAAPLTEARIVRNPYNVPYEPEVTWPGSDLVFKLACVGTLQPHIKGQDILFQVLREEKWRSRPVTLTLFGSGPNQRTIESLRRMWDLQNVFFGGFVKDIAALWAEHHALVLPSRVEGLPLAVVEAMLCSRPCIVTDIAGNAEVIDDNVSGFLAAAPTARLLDEAMERAWQRRAEWQIIGQIAAQRIRQLVPRDPIGVFAGELMQLLNTQ